MDAPVRFESIQPFLRKFPDIVDALPRIDVHPPPPPAPHHCAARACIFPAARLSRGTFRSLCRLARLGQSIPPPVVCLDEPAPGLDPDVLPGVADLLREASERCQLIVTTHSDTLVDALTDTPESVVVCEKEKGQTMLRRLDKGELSHCLEKYR